MEVYQQQHHIWLLEVEKRLADLPDVPEKLAVDPKIDDVEVTMTIYLVMMASVKMALKIQRS